MRKTGIFFAIMGLVYSLAIGYIAYQFGKDATVYTVANLNSEVMAEEVATSAPEPTPVVEKTYVIKEFNGRIGVYENGELIRIVDVNLEGFRAEDRKRLQEGIEVKEEGEVAGVIEDYTS